MVSKFGLRIEKYKSFIGEPGEFAEVLPINLVIGRNNSGKSALVDAVEFACAGRPKIQSAKLFLRTQLSVEQVQQVYSPNTYGGDIPGRNWWESAGKDMVGDLITVEFSGTNQFTFSDIARAGDKPPIASGVRSHLGQLASTVTNPFSGKLFHRLAAERDISPEIADGGLEIGKSGSGFSKTIAAIINSASLNSEIAERRLLDAVNNVCKPDSEFSRIKV